MLVGDESGFLFVRSDGGRFEVEDWQPLNLFGQLEPSTLFRQFVLRQFLSRAKLLALAWISGTRITFCVN